ncbi:MAG: LTA synthase family protein [Desulfobacterales bacterium]|nr:LTA synthase family protein [Desulfobacterales bacterium]
MKIKHKIYLSFVVTVTAFYSLLIQEWLARHSLLEAATWMNSHPYPFLVNLCMHFMVLLFFIALFGRFMLGLIIGCTILIFFATINAIKLFILHAPFFAWDVLYAHQLTALGKNLLPDYAWRWMFVFALVLVLLMIYYYWKSTIKLTVRFRCAIMAIIISCSGLIYYQSVPLLYRLQIQNMFWDQLLNYNINGFLLSFSMNISPLLIKKPIGYSNGLVEKVLTNQKSYVKTSGYEGYKGYKDQPVSVVFVMSESFWDLGGAPIKTNVEIMPNFKRLASTNPSFTVVSPTFAGATSLVEFEVLTGLSNAFLPPGSIPYDHYLRSPTPSLPWILRQNGYKTIAIHPFFDWFWSRNIVYPYLGFEEFISLEQFEGATTKYGEFDFVTDEKFVDKIIQVIDSQHGPYMIYAISMQNHGPFWTNRYKKNSVEISATISDWLKGEIEAYLTGIQDADRQLDRLVKYLSTRKEPVICVFFGDHQPAFSAQLFGELGMLPEKPEFLLQISKVPALIWANSKDLLNLNSIPKQFSTVYLPSIILEQMGIPKMGHFQYLMRGLYDMPVLHRDFVCDANGVLSSFKAKTLSSYLNGLEVLNYDVLFGSKFCWQMPIEPKDNNSSANANFVTECANFVTDFDPPPSL